MKTRKWIKPIDVVIIILLVIILLAILFFTKQPKNSNGIVQILDNGKVVEEFSLSNQEDRVFRLKSNEKVGFKIENHSICFIDVDCPDKLCENFGMLKNVGETAICLPNKVTLKVVNGYKNQDNEIDAVVN